MKAIQKLIQGQEWSQNTLWLPENFGNNVSFMSNYNINQVSQTLTNNTSSTNRVDGNRRSIATNMVNKVKNKRGCYIRKRSWTSTQVTSLIDDGYVWRKYGQKEITKAKHKRNYFRCTHKFDQGCQATKQVQQIDDEPPKYKITYNKHHTCKNYLSTPQIIFDSINLEDTSILISFKSNKLIDKEQVGSPFPSYTHEESNEALSSLGLRDNQLLLSEFRLPHNLTIMSDQPGASLMSTGLENEDVVSKGVYSPNFEMGYIHETIDYSENPFDLAHCELANFNWIIQDLARSQSI
ncbi:hypothetical protein LXL04_035949 [Taraxacum kok-saghyz]